VHFLRLGPVRRPHVPAPLCLRNLAHPKTHQSKPNSHRLETISLQRQQQACVGSCKSRPPESRPRTLKTLIALDVSAFPALRRDGLSDGKETPTLYKIEDALNLNVCRDCHAILSGRIRAQGRREIYFLWCNCLGSFSVSVVSIRVGNTNNDSVTHDG
jgi:uncharacterized protein DUF695